MKRSGFTLVEIMIVVAIITLLAGIAIPNLLAAKKTANEAVVKATLRALSTAAETYAVGHGSSYPSAVASPGLIDYMASADRYCSDAAGGTTAVQGYNYACTLDSTGYTFVATPVTFGTTGSITYTASTGASITPM